MRMRYGFLGILGLLGCGVTTVLYEPPPDPSTSYAQPVFNGEALQAATAPPPVTGGSVRIVKSGNASFAIVADAEEDVIDIVALDGAPHLTGTIALSPGDEPNRMVADAAGLVHVVLRSGGAIATIDPRTASLIARRPVCPAPRGIDYDAARDALYVACATGELVTLGSAGPVARVARLDRDLRDVIVTGSEILVTRFRSAEVLGVDPTSGAILSRSKPAPSTDSTYADMASVVAWRTLRNVSGGVIMLHQLASTQALVVVPTQTYYASAGSPISASAVSVESSGNHATALQIEVAIDATLDASGNIETLGLLGDIQEGLDGSQVDHIGNPSTSYGLIENHYQFVAIDDGGPIGVPYKVVQRRAPTAELEIFTSFGTTPTSVALPQKTSHLDTGFDVFHIPTSVGTACMNCHPEGGDDGHTWKFTIDGGSVEARRTQSLRGGVVTDGAPYHWNGDLATLGALCDEVFTHRMGGGKVTSKQEPIVAHWMNAIPRVPVRTDLDDKKVAAGKTIFEGVGGCTSCHTGAGSIATNQDIGKVDVLGQSRAMQVPALLDVADRAPYMHDGCAATLLDRFTNTNCGGSAHGNVTGLGSDDLSNLTTYLESL
jgi:hypothetical protein